LRIQGNGATSCGMLAPPARQDLLRIVAESLCDLRTVTRAYSGAPVTLASRARIRQAAEALGLPLPPDAVAKVPGVSGT